MFDPFLLELHLNLPFKVRSAATKKKRSLLRTSNSLPHLIHSEFIYALPERRNS